MNRKIALATCVALALGADLAQAQEERYKSQRMSDWNPQSADGRCQLRVWIGDTARIRMRGDDIWIQTQRGERSYLVGSACNQPLPFHGVEDFRVTAERGRGTAQVTQGPARRNNFTGTVVVSDPQGGGATYTIDIAWRNPSGFWPYQTSQAPDPFPWFDELRACQDKVRAEFLRRNRGDAYLEFVGVPDRDEMGRNRDRLRGEAYARNRTVTRPVNYECVLNERTNVVETAAYKYPQGNGGSVR